MWAQQHELQRNTTILQCRRFAHTWKFLGHSMCILASLNLISPHMARRNMRHQLVYKVQILMSGWAVVCTICRLLC